MAAEWERRRVELVARREQLGLGVGRDGNAADGRKGHELGVRIGWLLAFADALPARDMSTKDVCERVIKPATETYRCRYADLFSVREHDAVGNAMVFVSHCWSGRFIDLIAACRYAGLPPDVCVWIDIFAVNQHSHTAAGDVNMQQREDLDFAPVIRACDYFVLVAKPLDSVGRLDALQLMGTYISEKRFLKDIDIKDRLACAFWRVWCASIARAPF